MQIFVADQPGKHSPWLVPSLILNCLLICTVAYFALAYRSLRKDAVTAVAYAIKVESKNDEAVAINKDLNAKIDELEAQSDKDVDSYNQLVSQFNNRINLKSHPKTNEIINESIISKLHARFDTMAFDDGEKWTVGPSANITTPGPVIHETVADVRDGQVELTRIARDSASTTIRYDLRIAKLNLSNKGNGELTIDRAFEIWCQKLNAIIAEKELDCAYSALKNAQAENYQHPSIAQHAESIGDRFRTTVVVSRRRIEIALNWLNPKEPEAIEAKATIVNK